jgi:hypothetical protein
MGCGASQEAEPASDDKYADAGSSNAEPQAKEKEAEREAHDPDPYDEPASPEQLELQEQIDDHVDGHSVAMSAIEPTPFKKDMKISVKNLQARWKHGITSDPDQFTPFEEPPLRPKILMLVMTYIDGMVVAAEVDTSEPGLVLGNHQPAANTEDTVGSSAAPHTVMASMPHAIDSASEDNTPPTSVTHTPPTKLTRVELPTFAVQPVTFEAEGEAAEGDALDESQAANNGSPRMGNSMSLQSPGLQSPGFGSRSLLGDGSAGTPRLSVSTTFASASSMRGGRGPEPIFVDLGLAGRQFLFAPIVAAAALPMSPISFASSGKLGGPLQPPPAAMSLSVMSDDNSGSGRSMEVSMVHESNAHSSHAVPPIA